MNEFVVNEQNWKSHAAHLLNGGKTSLFSKI